MIAARRDIPSQAQEERRLATWERTYAIVLAGVALALTLLATVAYPIHDAIAFGFPGVDPGVVVLAGVGYWTLFGLVGALRSRPVAGGTVLTFHMPFIVAATQTRAKARDLAGRICERVAAPIMVREESLVVSTGTSIGILMLDGSAASAAEAINIADRRMQYAKKHKLGIWDEEVPPD